jgi:hypothetical protein
VHAPDDLDAAFAAMTEKPPLSLAFRCFSLPRSKPQPRSALAKTKATRSFSPLALAAALAAGQARAALGI